MAVQVVAVMAVAVPENHLTRVGDSDPNQIGLFLPPHLWVVADLYAVSI